MNYLSVSRNHAIIEKDVKRVVVDHDNGTSSEEYKPGAYAVIDKKTGKAISEHKKLDDAVVEFKRLVNAEREADNEKSN